MGDTQKQLTASNRLRGKNVSGRREITLQAKGQPTAEAAAPLYSNFVGISRVGTDIQFEFVFLDLNEIATVLQQLKSKDSREPAPISGKTVAKIIVPAATFLQLKGQIDQIYKAIEELERRQGVRGEHSNSNAAG